MPRITLRQARKSLLPFGITLQQKKFFIGMLSIVNVSMVGLTIHRDHTSRLQEVYAVQAFVAPSPAVEQASVQPVKSPVAIVASVTSEKVEPTPIPTPESAVAAVSLSRPAVLPATRGDWDTLLQAYFGSAWKEAKAIMGCESGGNSNAMGPVNMGGTRPYGLMQIMYIAGRPSPEWLLNPENNIAYAARMFKSQGWGPWECKRVLGR
jgi:hypothetical protein